MPPEMLSDDGESVTIFPTGEIAITLRMEPSAPVTTLLIRPIDFPELFCTVKPATNPGSALAGTDSSCLFRLACGRVAQIPPSCAAAISVVNIAVTNTIANNALRTMRSPFEKSPAPHAYDRRERFARFDHPCVCFACQSEGLTALRPGARQNRARLPRP